MIRKHFLGHIRPHRPVNMNIFNLVHNVQGLVQKTNLSYQGTFPKHNILIKLLNFHFYIYLEFNSCFSFFQKDHLQNRMFHQRILY